MTQIPNYQLNDGNMIPLLGFGTYKVQGPVGVNIMDSAINNGYRLLDSAARYENEGAVGEAIRRSSVNREDLFITSKLLGRHQQYDQALTAIQESLYRMGLDYFDLYLIHWPNPKRGLFVEAWQALIQAQKLGLVKSIGVSNFLPEHIDKLIKETGVTPAVDQVELHPYWSEPDVVKYNSEHHILTQAWRPLGRAKRIMSDPVLQDIAAAHNKSVPQVVLRWELQLGIGVIPKANSLKHQLSNKDIFDFELTNDEMKRISALDEPNGRDKKNQDPNVYEEL